MGFKIPHIGQKLFKFCMWSSISPFLSYFVEKLSLLSTITLIWVGGLFFHVILFHSKIGLGDQDCHKKIKRSFKNIFKFKFNPDPKF